MKPQQKAPYELQLAGAEIPNQPMKVGSKTMNHASALVDPRHLIMECDRGIAELTTQRQAAVEDLVAALTWMDVPFRRIRRHDHGAVAVDTEVHVFDMTEESSGRNRVECHAVDDCPAAWCKREGAVQRTRHRRGHGYAIVFRGVWRVTAFDGEGGAIITRPEALTRRPSATATGNRATEVHR